MYADVKNAKLKAIQIAFVDTSSIMSVNKNLHVIIKPKARLAVCVLNIKLKVVFSLLFHFFIIKKIKKKVAQTPIICINGKIVFTTSITIGTFKY